MSGDRDCVDLGLEVVEVEVRGFLEFIGNLGGRRILDFYFLWSWKDLN